MSAPGRDEIRDFLLREFPDEAIEENGDAGSLEIAARHPAVGPLAVEFADDEITVFVGPTHCHFERAEDATASEAFEPAIAFIRAVLADRMVLWSCLGAAGAYSIESGPRRRVPWPVRRYLWSGPIA